jgi:hypothetical protein
MSARTCMLLLLVCMAARLAACGATGRAPPAPAPDPPGAPMHPPIAVDPPYRSAVEARIARMLHTSPADVRSKLSASPSSTLMNLAKPLGLAQDQLGAIVVRSLGDAARAAVRSGRRPPSAARKEQRYWEAQSAPSLIAEVSRWIVRG